MDKRNDYTDRIEAYVNGSLTGEELRSFESEIKNNPKIKEEVRLYKEMDKAIVMQDIAEMKNRISLVREGMKNDKFMRLRQSLNPFVVLRNSPKLAYAASLLVILGVVSLLYFTLKTTPSEKQLFAAYFSPYPAGVVERSSDTADTLFVNAMTAYNKNNFQQAILLLEQVETSDTTGMAVDLYLGISFLETGNLKNASKRFRKILSSKDHVFKEQAQWYLCLTLLKQKKDKEEVRPLLRQLINEKGDYTQQAREMMRKLRR